MSDVYTHSAWTLSLSLSLSQGKTIKVYPVETVQQLTQQRIEEVHVREQLGGSVAALTSYAR